MKGKNWNDNSHTARLESKLLLSATTQCFHLEFSIDELSELPFIAGQFISTVADDRNGKQQTRAYSLASAPRGNHFDLCLNRVEGGFFSNLLCDLEVGQTVPFHGATRYVHPAYSDHRQHPDRH